MPNLPLYVSGPLNHLSNTLWRSQTGCNTSYWMYLNKIRSISRTIWQTSDFQGALDHEKVEKRHRSKLRLYVSGPLNHLSNTLWRSQTGCNTSYWMYLNKIR